MKKILINGILPDVNTAHITILVEVKGK